MWKMDYEYQSKSQMFTYLEWGKENDKTHKQTNNQLII